MCNEEAIQVGAMDVQIRQTLGSRQQMLVWGGRYLSGAVAG